MAIVIGESSHSQFQGTSTLSKSLDKHVLSLIAPPSIAPCVDAVGICTNAVALTLLLVIYVNIFIKVCAISTSHSTHPDEDTAENDCEAILKLKVNSKNPTVLSVPAENPQISSKGNYNY